jgi:hypothetical protein
VARINNLYELTLDTKVDPFLGINISHNDDGMVMLTQPKLLQKLFKEHPERPAAKMPSHLYGPVPPHNKKEDQSPPILVTTYLHLQGLLM